MVEVYLLNCTACAVTRQELASTSTRTCHNIVNASNTFVMLYSVPGDVMSSNAASSSVQLCGQWGTGIAANLMHLMHLMCC